MAHSCNIIYNDKQILYSPSDLVSFLGCSHSSFLDYNNIDNITNFETSASIQLFQKKGIEHEISYLEKLKKENVTIQHVQLESNILLKKSGNFLSNNNSKALLAVTPCF